MALFKIHAAAWPKLQDWKWSAFCHQGSFTVNYGGQISAASLSNASNISNASLESAGIADTVFFHLTKA